MMSHDHIGPKQAQLRALREATLKNQKEAKKPSTADLRSTIDKIKPKGKKTGRRGR